MTRACARHIENEVNSFLFKSRLDSCEDWILPQTETLLTLRYEEDDREKEKVELRATMEQENEGEAKEKEGKKLLDTPGARTEGPRVPGLEDKGGPNPLDAPGARPSQPRVPGLCPGHALAGPGCLASQPRVPGPAHSAGPGCAVN